MPRQLVFASVPAGLAPGRSGYCTAARSAELGERLVRELETAGAHEPGEGVAYTFRLLRAGSETCAVLTRYADAGPDYTGRASTLAHHLVFSSDEIAAMPPPADIARRFTGWLDRWDGPPRLLDGPFHLAGTPASLPASAWKRLAGDAGKAALFCDDTGRAKPATLPAPGGADTLALLAEAALLLEDKGWTTPFTTRLRDPDPFAVWRASPDVGAAALPSPGLARRATLARSGVMAGARPKAYATTGAPFAHGPTADDSSPDSPRRLLWAGCAVTLVAVLALIFALYGRETPRAPAPPPVREDPAAPASGKATEPPARAPHPLLTELRAARKAGDTAGVARAWLALGESSPSDAQPLREDLTSELRERLVRDGLARLGAPAADAKAVPDAASRKRLRESLAELGALASRLGISPTPEQTAQIEAVGSRLSAMESALGALPSCHIARPRWTNTGDTALAAIDTADLGEAPDFAGFLSAPHARLRLTFSPFLAFGTPADPTFVHEVPAKDFSPGKALLVTHPEHRMLLSLGLDSRKRLSLTRRTPKAASPALRLPGGKVPELLTLTDTDTGESASLLLLPFAATAPHPLKLPADCLLERDGAVITPPWLASLVARVSAAGAKPTLLPAGHVPGTRDLPALTASRFAVEQGLRSRLAALPSDAGEAARLREAMANLPGNLRDAGAPWVICIAPPGTPVNLTIIQFAQP